MTRKLMTFVVTAFALASIAGAAWSMSGVVVDSRGKPVPRANVYAWRFDVGRSKRTLLHADSKGAFSFKSPVPGTYCYHVEAQGFGYSTAFDMTDNPNAKITIKLWPEKKITGRVVDPAGKPVPGVTVSIVAFQGWNSPSDMTAWAESPIPLLYQPAFAGGVQTDSGMTGWTLSPSPLLDQSALAGGVQTDKHGAFALGHVPDFARFKKASLTLRATARGRAPATKSYQKADFGKSLKIVSSPGCSLSGTVYLPGKSGVAPQTVGVTVQGAGLCYHSARLDKNGAFAFDDLPPGPVTVKIGGESPDEGGPPGMAAFAGPTDWILPAMPMVTMVPGQPKKLELVLARGTLIKGKIVDKASGKSATGGLVSIGPAGAREDETTGAEIDKQGEFSARVAPGDLRITILTAQIGGKYVGTFDPDEAEQGGLSQDVTVADGEEKSDVVFQVDPNAQEDPYFLLGSVRSLPPGFELTAGTYRLTWDPNAPGSDMFSYGGESYDAAQAKAKTSRLPELKSKKPFFTCVALDSATDLLWCVFDQSNAAGKGYDTLYVDANRNGDLTDDQPVTWRSTGTSGYTPWVEVQAHQGTGDTRTSNPVKIRWRMTSGDPSSILRKGAWTGTFDTSKGPARVILMDTNGNGAYNDFAGVDPGARPSGDQVAFRLGSESGPMLDWQGLTQGVPNVLGSKGYIFSANATGSELTVKPYTGPLGKLLIGKINIGGHGGKLSSVSMSGRYGDVEYDIAAGKPLILPAGDYTINYVWMSVNTGSKTIEVMGDLSRSVHIKPNGQTILDITGKPRLTLQSDKRIVVLNSGVVQPIDWGYDLGGGLKDAVLLDSPNANAVAKVRFDSSRKAIPVRPNPGAG